MNCETYSSFEGVSSNHQIVTAKVRLSLWKNDTRTATTKHFNWALLNNRDIRDKYVVALRSKLDALCTPNDEYENFVNAHLEVAAKYIPTKLRAKSRVPWETLAVREKRADVKTASKCNGKNPTDTTGGNTPQSSSCTATYLPSRKLSKLDEPDMQDTAREAGTSS